MRIKKLLLLIQAFIALTVTAQVNTDDIQLIIKASQAEIPLQYPDFIKAVYQENDYNYLWLNNNQYTIDRCSTKNENKIGPAAV